MVSIPIKRPIRKGIGVNKQGNTGNAKRRFICKTPDRACKTFIRDYSGKGPLPEWSFR